jgi:hypothetical protein
MSHNVQESDNFVATIPVPDRDDPGSVFVPTVAAATGGLANRTRHTHNTLTGNATFDALDFVGVSEQLATQYIIPTERLGPNNLWTVNLTRVAQSLKWLKQRVVGLKAGTQQIWVPPYIFSSSAGDWALKNSGAGGAPFALQAEATSTSSVVIPLPNFARAGTLTTVTMRVSSLVVHSALPANMPKLEVFRFVVASPSGDYSPFLVGDATDASASVAAYDATHTVSVTGRNEDFASPVTSFAGYAVKVTGEWGTNANQNALQLWGLELTIAGAT